MSDGPAAAGLPVQVRDAVERRLTGTGGAVRIASARRVGGGCINPSARIDLTDGRSFFLKWNAGAPLGFFAAEAEGLEALRVATALRVPSVAAVGDGDDAAAEWLLLELVPEGLPGRDYGESLGLGLAELHRPVAEGPGWNSANFIGPLPQDNAPARGWPSFWRDRRLEPQLRRAREAGYLAGADARSWERVLARIDDLLADVGEEPSLLHGDLWSGNVYPGPGGEPVVVDPAVYRGHREVDLAMMELFGGFPASCRPAYEDARPLTPGYEEIRRDVYQLYPLLVHVNLFGGGYVESARDRVERLLARSR